MEEIFETAYGNDFDKFMADTLQQDFIKFCREEAEIKGFPTEFKNIKEFARFCAIIVWTTTGYHSLSFAVEFIDSYVPFKPACMERPFPMEVKTKDLPISYVVNSLP